MFRNASFLKIFLILSGSFLLLLTFGPLLVSEAWFFLKELRNQRYILSSSPAQEPQSVFFNLISRSDVLISPINYDFSLVIERIGVNAPIVPDVSVLDGLAYKDALKRGIAHALSSSYPSELPGNTYLFAHASLNFWDLGKYATVFNLLRKLNLKDTVHVYFQQKDYVYEVVNKEVVSGWDVSSLNRSVIEPLLTLQTCDPPGTTLNRLIITAKLVSVRNLDIND